MHKMAENNARYIANSMKYNEVHVFASKSNSN